MRFNDWWMHGVWVLLAGVWMSCVSPVGAADAAEAYERRLCSAGLEKLGIRTGCEIVVGDISDEVERTAAETMQRLLSQGGVQAAIVTESTSMRGQKILLGRDTNVRAIKAHGDTGEICIRDVPVEEDGYHLKKLGDGIVIAGANSRGVLYGVYAFEDYVNRGAVGALDIKTVPHFRKRGSGLHYTDVFFNATLEAFPEAKAAYLARLGINEFTDQGIGGPLGKFVQSDVFPFKTSPDPSFQGNVKAMSATCRKYGIDFYLFIVEPTLEALSDGYVRYPEEALGTVRPPWGGDVDGVARTLCVNSPVAQQYLREMMKRLVREYPDVKGIQLYNLDAGSWFCTPALCERCKAASPAADQEAFNPADTQANLVALLAEAAHEERADFQIKFWSTVHYHGERFDRMIGAAEGYNALLSSWTGSDRSVMVPGAAVRSASCVRSQDVCATRDVPFYMMTEFNNLEMLPKSLPFPFHVAQALKRYAQWDIANLTEIFGVAAEHNSINALVAKEFEWDPARDVEPFLRDLSLRQFGAPAGALMYQAWEEMRRAFDVWNEVSGPPFPLNGSQFHVKMGLAIGGLPPAIVPTIVEYYDSTIDILTKVEPWLAEGYRHHTTEAFLATMERMNAHLAMAAAHAKSAIDVASDDAFIDTVYYRGEGQRPTCKTYAELNHAPIAIAHSLCTQRCNILRAYLLQKGTERSRAAGDEAAAREKDALYHELVHEDIGVQERFIELLTEFAAMKPCYTRTSLTEQEISDCISVTQGKIAELQRVLGE